MLFFCGGYGVGGIKYKKTFLWMEKIFPQGIPLVECVGSLQLGCCSLDYLFPLPYSCRVSTRYFNRLDDLSATIPRCYKDVYVNSFFPCTTRFWNYLTAQFFPLTYDLNGFQGVMPRCIYFTGCFL